MGARARTCALTFLLILLAPLAHTSEGDARDCGPAGRADDESNAARPFRLRYEKFGNGSAAPFVRQITKRDGSYTCHPDTLRGRPVCGQLNFSSPLAGHIFLDGASNVLFYEPDACVLRRLSREEARTCLASVGPVVYIGDSVTRYTYLSMLHFLSAGTYQHPYDKKKSLTNAHKHKGQEPWENMWKHARAQVKEHDSRGGFLYFNFDLDTHLEHAHLQLEDRAGNKLHVWYHYLARADDGKAELIESIDWAFSKDTIKSSRGPMFMINSCAHYTKTSNASYADDVIGALQQAAKRLPAGSRVVWSSCTSPNVRELIDGQEARIQAAAKEVGFEVLDLRALAMATLDQDLQATWFAGSVHYVQFMYEQFNDVLLNILCPPGGDGSSRSIGTSGNVWG